MSKEVKHVGYRPRLSLTEQLAIANLRTKKVTPDRIVGVVGDIHEPFSVDGYFEFVADTFEREGVTDVVFIGDIVDQHAISFHDADPDGMSAGDELVQAKLNLAKWYERFPVAKICIGNHDHLPARKAFKHGLSTAYVRTLHEVLECPEGWVFDWEFDIDDVGYFHGTGFSGMYAHVNAMKQKRKSVVMGHLHGNFGVEYSATDHDLLWGMATGCGVDRHSYAQSYGKDFPRKPILGCGTVTNGIIPKVHPMPLTSYVRNHRSN